MFPEFSGPEAGTPIQPGGLLEHPRASSIHADAIDDMTSKLTLPAVGQVDIVASSTFTIETPGESFIDITAEVRRFLAACGGRDGLVTLFIRHTSASLTIQENADPDVLRDLTTALRRFAPQDGGWIHDAEGPDDMPAHIRTMLTSVSLQIPVIAGALVLGTWQAIYLVEHRTKPHRREIALQFIGAGTSG